MAPLTLNLLMPAYMLKKSETSSIKLYMMMNSIFVIYARFLGDFIIQIKILL